MTEVLGAALLNTGSEENEYADHTDFFSLKLPKLVTTLQEKVSGKNSMTPSNIFSQTFSSNKRLVNMECGKLTLGDHGR